MNWRTRSSIKEEMLKSENRQDLVDFVYKRASKAVDEKKDFLKEILDNQITSVGDFMVKLSIFQAIQRTSLISIIVNVLVEKPELVFDSRPIDFKDALKALEVDNSDINALFKKKYKNRLTDYAKHIIQNGTDKAIRGLRFR
jgi:hypothetical protein